MTSCFEETIEPENFSATPAQIHSGCFSNVASYGDCEAVAIDSIAVTYPEGRLLYRFFVTYAAGISEVLGVYILVKYNSGGILYENEYFDDPSNINVDYVLFPEILGNPEEVEVRLSVACGNVNNRSNYSKPYIIKP